MTKKLIISLAVLTVLTLNVFGQSGISDDMMYKLSKRASKQILKILLKRSFIAPVLKNKRPVNIYVIPFRPTNYQDNYQMGKYISNTIASTLSDRIKNNDKTIKKNFNFISDTTKIAMMIQALPPDYLSNNDTMVHIFKRAKSLDFLISGQYNFRDPSYYYLNNITIYRSSRYGLRKQSIPQIRLSRYNYKQMLLIPGTMELKFGQRKKAKVKFIITSGLFLSTIALYATSYYYYNQAKIYNYDYGAYQFYTRMSNYFYYGSLATAGMTSLWYGFNAIKVITVIGAKKHQLQK